MSTINTNYEEVSTSALKLHPDNPRRGDVAAVAASIEAHGFFGALVVQKSSGYVLAGNHRLLAARQLNHKAVPVVWVDVDDITAKRILLADNKTGDLADYDDELLRAILGELNEADELTGTGYTDDEVSALLGLDADALAPAEVPPDMQLDGDAISQPGEIYQLGPHRLICGDCRDHAVVSRLMDGASVAVAFTSPPYASQRKYDESSDFQPIRPDEFVEWFDAVQQRVQEHLASDGSWFVNIKEHCEDGQRVLYVKDLTIAHVRQWGWRFVDEFAWTKSGVPGVWDNRFKNAWEPVFQFSRSRYIKIRPDNVKHESGEMVIYSPDNAYTHSGLVSGNAKHGHGMALSSNVLTIHNHPRQVTQDDQVKHTATFPVDLPVFFIEAFSDREDVVYDPFMGSGTTLIAAAQTGRAAYGCEISPIYCDLIRRRWGKYAESAGVDPGDAL